MTYEDTGNVLTTADQAGHITTYSYTGNQNAYLTSVTLPNTGVAHTGSFAYNANTGLMTSSTDQNGQQTTYSYDAMLRPAATGLPDGGQTTETYNITGAGALPYTTHKHSTQRDTSGILSTAMTRWISMGVPSV